jgi:hypothetical protein
MSFGYINCLESLNQFKDFQKIAYLSLQIQYRIKKINQSAEGVFYVMTGHIITGFYCMKMTIVARTAAQSLTIWAYLPL